MKNNKVLSKEMIALMSINATARKEIDGVIKEIIKAKIEESVNRPSESMIKNTLMPCYYDRAGVPMDDKQVMFLWTRCSRDKVQMIIDILKQKYSTINQRKELVKQIEGIRKHNTNTYLKVKMELYPRLFERECIDEFFTKCTAIYQMQPANVEQIRQIKSIAMIPEVYEALRARDIDLRNHLDINGNVQNTFDKEIMDRMNYEDASSFIQFYYTYKQIYQGRALTPLQRNTLKRMYTQLGETDKASPIHLMYIDSKNYDKVVNELNERLRRNSIAQETAYEVGQGMKQYRANEWTYENMRATNKELMQTKELLKFVHTLWSAMGERYQDDEELEALLPYMNIAQTSASHIKEDSINNQRKLRALLRQKLGQALKMGAVSKRVLFTEFDEMFDFIYPDVDEFGNVIE